MEETLQFLVMVEGPADEATVLDLVRTGLPDAVPYRRGSVQVRGNLLEINHNEFADPRLAATDPDDGFLSFGWRVELTPADATVDEDHQILLARALVRTFEHAGAQAVVCANFEDRV